MLEQPTSIDGPYETKATAVRTLNSLDDVLRVQGTGYRLDLASKPGTVWMTSATAARARADEVEADELDDVEEDELRVDVG